jgi:hypothetical protein
VQRRRWWRCHVVVVPVRARRQQKQVIAFVVVVEAGAVTGTGRRPGHGPEAAGGVVQGVRRGGPRQGLLPQELQVDQGPRLRMVVMYTCSLQQLPASFDAPGYACMVVSSSTEQNIYE